MPARNSVPPIAIPGSCPSTRSSAITPAPAVTSTNCASTTPSGGAGEAVSASTKFCIAPEIAVETAPASARCRGSQTPTRSASGSRSETAARVSHSRAATM